MRRSFSSVLPETGHGPGAESRNSRALVIERIAGWSARHRKTAVLGWLALVAVVFVGGQMLSAKSVPSYDVGQSGQAEQTLHRLGVTTPPAESVLIQARAGARPRGGGTFAADPRLRQAAAQLVAALRALPHTAQDIRSPVSPGGASALAAGRAEHLGGGADHRDGGWR